MSAGKKILSWVDHYCNLFREGRPAGTFSVAEYIIQDFLNTAFLPVIQTFKCSPNAFLGFIYVSTPIILFSAIMLLQQQFLLCLVSWLLFMGIVIGEFLLYKEILDPLFKTKSCYNVIATQQVKKNKLILLTGHHDSARIFRYLEVSPILYLILMISYMITGFGGFIYFIFCWIFSLPSVFLAISIIIVHSLFLFFLSSKYSPGAGDNLVSVGILLELAKYFSKKPLKNTELRFCSFDAEESGLRGSKAYLKYIDSLKTEYDSIEVINIDSVFKLKDLCIISKELNGTVSLEQSIIDKILKIAKKYNKKAYKFIMGPGTGATDGATFGQYKIPVATIMAIGVNPLEKNCYHTSSDLPANIEPEAVEAVFDIIKEFLLKSDRN